MTTAIILGPLNVDKLDFHCIRCTRYLFSINREILVISFGTAYPTQEVPRNMGWLKHQCHSCKMEFNFYFN